jgi:hypothetical protein
MYWLSMTDLKLATKLGKNLVLCLGNNIVNIIEQNYSRTTEIVCIYKT